MTAPDPANGGTPPGSTRVCLLMSDREAAVQLADALAPDGIHCLAAGTVTEATRQSTVEGYDLILLDAEVYGADTASACRRLTETWPRCPLVVLASDSIRADEFAQAGAARVVVLAGWQRDQLQRMLAILLENVMAGSDLEAFRSVLQTVLEHIEDGIVLTDRAGQHLLSNRAARRLLEVQSRAVADGDASAETARARDTVREIALTDSSGDRFGGMLHLRPLESSAEVSAYESVQDPRTGLLGPEAFRQSLQRVLARRQRDGGRCAVLLLDLDRFRSVRDTLGTAFADRMIVSMASALSTGMRRSDLLARMARDEFAVLIEDFAEETELVHIARKLLQLVRTSAREESRWPDLTASVGIAVSPEQGITADALLGAADHALSQTKSKGGNAYSFCCEDFQQKVSRHLDLHLALQGALAREEFSLDYQPIIALDRRRVSGFEALLRWRSPAMGNVPPTEFVPILERTGMIQAVGEWVLETACREIRVLQQRFARPDLSVSVNLSVRQIENDSLVAIARRVLERTGIDAACLVLEVTESLLMTEPERAAETLRRLSMLGAHVFIDDFGTGYSSLSYIKTLPVSGLKIDRVFLKGVPDQPRDVGIVRGTLALAHSLGLLVTAEGVETEPQLQLLEALGCDLAQGYLLGRPGPVETAARRLETDPR